MLLHVEYSEVTAPNSSAVPPHRILKAQAKPNDPIKANFRETLVQCFVIKPSTTTTTSPKHCSVIPSNTSDYHHLYITTSCSFVLLLITLTFNNFLTRCLFCDCSIAAASPFPPTTISYPDCFSFASLCDQQLDRGQNEHSVRISCARAFSDSVIPIHHASGRQRPSATRRGGKPSSQPQLASYAKGCWQRLSRHWDHG